MFKGFFSPSEAQEAGVGPGHPGKRPAAARTGPRIWGPGLPKWEGFHNEVVYKRSHVCTYIYIHINTDTSANIYMYTYIYIHIYMIIYVYIELHVCMRIACMHVYIHARMHACMHTYSLHIHAHMHVCTHASLYTYKYTRALDLHIVCFVGVDSSLPFQGPGSVFEALVEPVHFAGRWLA